MERAPDHVIGGEFRIEPDILDRAAVDSSYAGGDCVYSLGRGCLYAILSAWSRGGAGGVLLPDYLCRSIAEVPVRLGMPYQHYHITEEFLPDPDSIRRQAERGDGRQAILLIAYFGMVCLDEAIEAIRREYPNVTIIIDDVQNYYGFGDHVDYDHCFTSYRKWFPVPDGADVLQKNDMSLPEPRERPAYVPYKAAGNLLKNHRSMIGDSVALELLARGEAMMEEGYCCKGSDIGRRMLRRIDAEAAREARRRNASILHEGLEQLGITHLYEPRSVPLFIPIVVCDRDRVRRSLFERNIFAPIHWPIENRRLQGQNRLYLTELSLICDQRYDEADMDRIIRGIHDGM